MEEYPVQQLEQVLLSNSPLKENKENDISQKVGLESVNMNLTSTTKGVTETINNKENTPSKENIIKTAVESKLPKSSVRIGTTSNSTGNFRANNNIKDSNLIISFRYRISQKKIY